LINPKFCVSLPHWCSTTVSLETNPAPCKNTMDCVTWKLIVVTYQLVFGED